MNKEKFEKIKNYLENLNDRDLLDMWNAYSRECSNGDEIFRIEDFDEECECLTPYDIACKIHYGDLDLQLSYFKFNAYGNFESINANDLKDYIDFEDLTNCILDEDEDFNDERIREILSEN